MKTNAVLDAPRKRVSDGREREKVRGPGEQELSARLIAVQAPLDRQQQARYTLNLVDHRCPVDSCDKASRICPSCVRCRLIIEADQSGRVLIRRDVRDQCALADLPGSEQRDGAALSKRLKNLRANVTRKEAFWHPPRLPTRPGRL